MLYSTGLAAPLPSPAILLGGREPCCYFPSSCALVSDRVCWPPSYRQRFSGGNRSFVSTASRRESGGTAFAPIVVRVSLRSCLPAAVIPLMVIRRQSFVREHLVAAGVEGNSLCLGCGRTHGDCLRPRPIQRGTFAPRASDVASRAPHLVRDRWGYGRHLALPL